MNAASTPIRPGRIVVIAIYLAFAAQVARTLASTPDRGLWPAYIGLHLVYLALFTAVMWRPSLPAGVLHLNFVVQSAIILAILALNPQLDLVTALFVLLCYQAALVFTGATRWVWVGIFLSLTAGSLIFILGPLKGLSAALSPMAVSIVFAAYVVANHEIETAQTESQAILDEIRETHRQLQAYADQVEELATMQERNRLARELHDSVSQTIFSIILNTRSAQILLERDSAQVKPLLEQLQVLTQNALAEMRSLITQLRPQEHRV